MTIFLAPLVGGLMAGFAAECELASGARSWWWSSTSVSRTTVFAQIAFYADMVI